MQSPVGMPGCALRSPLMERVEAGLQPRVDRCIRCLRACNPAQAPYCISRALMSAVQGDWQNGLFFCGANAGDRREMTTVRDEITRIMKEWSEAQ